LSELEEKLKVLTTRVNSLEEDVVGLKHENRDEEIIKQYQQQIELLEEKRDKLEQVAASEKTLTLELDKKPDDALILEKISAFFQNNDYNHLCNAKEKIKLFGKLISIVGSTINPATNKTIPAKIVLIDSAGRTFRGVIWSATMEEKLTQLLQSWIVLDSVYFKRVRDQYLSKDFHIFETVNQLENRLERNQYEFQVSKCKVFRVKVERRRILHNMQEIDYDPWEENEDIVHCHVCSQEMIIGLEDHSCPNCHEPTCLDCCERLSDMYWGWCDFCMRR